MSQRPDPFPRHGINESPASLSNEFLVGSFDEYGPGAWASTPHRHDFVELMWVTSGAGEHVIDASSHPVRPNTLYVVAPGRLHHWEPAGETVTGTLVLFREEFLRDTGTAARIVDCDVLVPGADTARRIERLLVELRIEIGSGGEERATVLRSLLTALIVVCARVAPSPSERRSPGIVSRFEQLVREHAVASLTVAECARALGVTPGHLSECVAAATGSTPGELIRAAVLREAQRLLIRTELSCSQVAALLEFDDPSYFSRFFHRESGLRPSEFRRADTAAGSPRKVPRRPEQVPRSG